MPIDGNTANGPDCMSEDEQRHLEDKAEAAGLIGAPTPPPDAGRAARVEAAAKAFLEAVKGASRREERFLAWWLWAPLKVLRVALDEPAPTPASEGLVKDVAWLILQSLHKEVADQERPMSWSDVNGEQENRLRNAAKLAIGKVAETYVTMRAALDEPVGAAPEGAMDVAREIALRFYVEPDEGPEVEQDAARSDSVRTLTRYLVPALIAFRDAPTTPTGRAERRPVEEIARELCPASIHGERGAIPCVCDATADALRAERNRGQ